MEQGPLGPNGLGQLGVVTAAFARILEVCDPFATQRVEERVAGRRGRRSQSVEILATRLHLHHRAVFVAQFDHVGRMHRLPIQEWRAVDRHRRRAAGADDAHRGTEQTIARRTFAAVEVREPREIVVANDHRFVERALRVLGVALQDSERLGLDLQLAQTRFLLSDLEAEPHELRVVARALAAHFGLADPSACRSGTFALAVAAIGQRLLGVPQLA